MGKKLLKSIFLFILFLILVFAVAFGLYVFKTYRDAKANLKTQSGLIRLTGEKYDVSVKDDYWFGAASPKVTIIEFADFACPHCESSFSVIRELITKYKNDVKLVYKDYPQFDASLDLAMAARCAGEQGLFWPMHDKLFLNQGLSGETAALEAAKQIGIIDEHLEDFKTCFKSQKYLDQIRNDTLEGERIGLSGTPAWIVNGYMVKGDIPFDVWDKLIKQLTDKQ